MGGDYEGMKMCCQRAFMQGGWQFCPDCGSRVRVVCKRVEGTFGDLEYDWYYIEDAEQNTWFRTYFDNSLSENYRGWVGARLMNGVDKDYYDIVVWTDVLADVKALQNRMRIATSGR